MATVVWVYEGSEGIGDDEDENRVMEATIGDYLLDEVYGRVVLLADDTGEGTLTVLLSDGEEKQRTKGHLRTAPCEREVEADDMGGPTQGEVSVGREGGHAAETHGGTEQVSTEDAGEVQPAPDVQEVEREEDATHDAGIVEKVIDAAHDQCNLVGFDTQTCDVYFYKSVVRTTLHVPHRPY
jgi:hypothetical protein